MFYVFCKFVPDNPSFKTGAGAWKVTACLQVRPEAESDALREPVVVMGNEVTVTAAKKRRPGDFCNPRKILAEFLRLRGCLFAVPENG